jgi:inosine-uridine nucleoside N-ribohydrolase
MKTHSVGLALCCLALLLVSACTASSSPALEPGTPHPLAADARSVVIDTDMAADDWLAILYLLQRPDVDVRAITVSGTGEAHCAPGMRNALNLLALSGRPDVPVACGRETPMEGDRAFPADWRERVDGLFGLSLPENPNGPSAGSAVELLTGIIQSAPHKVYLITLGPLTNVAEALEQDPSLVDTLHSVIIMGGAVRVAGNVGPSSDIDNTVAEWNLYVDPHAASVVFRSGAAVTLVPLDATNHAPMTMDFYRRLEQDRTTPVAEFAYRVLAENREFISSGGYYFWDPLAAAILTKESLVTFQDLRLRVVEGEGPQSGRTLEHNQGDSVRVAMTADRERFETLFLDGLNARLP